MIRKQTKILEMDCTDKHGYLEIPSLVQRLRIGCNPPCMPQKCDKKTLPGMRGFITMNKAELIS